MTTRPFRFIIVLLAGFSCADEPEVPPPLPSPSPIQQQTPNPEPTPGPEPSPGTGEEATGPNFWIKPVDIPTYNNYGFLLAEIDQQELVTTLPLIEDHGFVWSKLKKPAVGDGVSTEAHLGPKSNGHLFSAYMYELEGNTFYNVRAFIKSSGKIYYSTEASFQTRPGSWRKLSDFPGTTTVNGASFVLNGVAYVLVGNEVWTYSPSLDAWDRKNDFPMQTDGPTGFAIGGVGYIYCGNVWRYNDTNDQWTAMLPLTQPSALHKGCKGVFSFVWQGKAYIGGGAGNLNEKILVYDPVPNTQDNLDFTHSSPNVNFASATGSDGKVYVVGGYNFTGSVSSQVLYYDLVNKLSGKKRSFNADDTERAEMVGFVVNGEMYLGMGFGTYGQLLGGRDDFYRYDASQDYWVPQTSLIYIDNKRILHPLRRAGGIGFAIGSKGYIGLGESREYNSKTTDFDTSPMYDFWEFTPN
ncbi:MAG TPA: hypothetical protein PKN99_08215 [Cyclobacteriaceae bacterium]|nr:hypothetical protein [Cyclobacteriaceae bacterium]